MPSVKRHLERSPAARLISLTGLFLTITVACADERSVTEANLRDWLTDRKVEGDVAATVNGTKIPLSFVQTQAQQRGVSHRRALDDLIVGVAAYDQVDREGAQNLSDEEIALLRKKLMVQLMLADLEREHHPDRIDPARVKAYYERKIFRFRRPELRRVDHIVVMARAEPGKSPFLPEELKPEADKVARELRKEIERRGWQDSMTPYRFYRLRDEFQVPPRLKLHVDTNMLSPEEDWAPPEKRKWHIPALVPEFTRAVYSMDEGTLSQPVASPFGSHVIWLREIIPPSGTTLEESAPGIREFLARQDRSKAVSALIIELNKKGSIAIAEEPLDRLAHGSEDTREGPDPEP